jgi:hypothetical protein
MTQPYTCTGKQVLLGEKHIADAGTNELADRIVAGLNAPEYLEYLATRQKSHGVKLALQVAAQNIRTGLHIPDQETARG